MPCYDGRGSDDSGNEIGLRREVAALQARLDGRTDLLCRTLKSIKESAKHIYDVLPQDIRDWHREHEVYDRLRARGVVIQEKK